MPHSPDALPSDSPDDDLPIDDLDEDYFLAAVARIMAEARDRAAGGDPPP